METRSTAAVAAPTITDEQRRDFQEKGYFILERVIPPEVLDVLTAELDRYIQRIDDEMDAQGVEKLHLNHKGKRYFVAGNYRSSEVLQSFLFSDLMAEICRATVGDDAWFFLEQFVVKYAEVGMSFSWHQDSGYLKAQLPHYTRPYLTCWIALDDVNEENGTIYVLPYDRAGTRDVIDHVRDPETNDMVGYTGDDPGDPVIIPAGSICVFSTTVLHRSGANTTDKRRRCYVVQFSPEPILNPDGTPRIFAEPFLKDGQRV